MKKPPTQDQMDNSQREQTGLPNYDDEIASNPVAKKGSPFNPALDQPQYIYWKKRWEEYR